MGVLKIIRHTNKDLNYLYNAINYVTHGHTDPDNIGSPNTSIYDAYSQMYSVKQYFGKTGGNPLFHFVVVYNPRTANDVVTVYRLIESGELSAKKVRYRYVIKAENIERYFNK